MGIASTLKYNKWKFIMTAVVVIVGLNAVAVAREPDAPQYKASALVLASDLAIRVDTFPRTAVAIFNGGTVARLAANYAGTGIAPEDLIPEIVSISPVENTAVVDIDAIHPDPQLAALYANAAGRALAEELNRVGPGLGSFALQIEASAPVEPLVVSRLPTVLFSGVAALLMVAGLASLVAFLQGSGHAVPLFRGPVRNLETQGDLDDDSSDESGGDATKAIIGTVKLGKQALSPTIEPQADAKAQKAVEPGRPSVTTFERSLAPPPAPRAEEPVPHSISTRDDLVPIQPLISPLQKLEQPSPMHPLLFVDEEAAHVLESIEGVDAIFAARLVAAGITSIEELSSAEGKWLSDAIEVRRDIVVDWVSQAVRLTSAPVESPEPDMNQLDDEEQSELDSEAGVHSLLETGISSHQVEMQTSEGEADQVGSSSPVGGREQSSGPTDSPSAVRTAPPMASGSTTNGYKKPPPTLTRPSEGDDDALTLRSVRGIGAVFAERLITVGIATIDDLANANASGLAYTMEVRYGTVADWIKQAKSLSSPGVGEFEAQ